MFAEAAVCTKRVILQHEAAEAGKAEVGEDTLSPPSQSLLMKRRHAQLNTKGVSRRGSCGTLIEVCLLLNFTPGRNRPSSIHNVIYIPEVKAETDRGVSGLSSKITLI